jgi:hypothetical protein
MEFLATALKRSVLVVVEAGFPAMLGSNAPAVGREAVAREEMGDRVAHREVEAGEPSSRVEGGTRQEQPKGEAEESDVVALAALPVITATTAVTQPVLAAVAVEVGLRLARFPSTRRMVVTVLTVVAAGAPVAVRLPTAATAALGEVAVQAV